MRAVKVFLTVASAILVFSVPVRASDGQSAGEKSAAPEVDFSNWWQKSSLDFAKTPGRILWHADGTLSFLQASGNSSGSTFDTRAGFDARRWRLTSSSFLQVSKRDITYGFGAGSAQYSDDTLREQVDLDLTRRVMLLGGVEYYRNTLMFMDRRLNKYGFLFSDSEPTEKHKLDLMVALGHASFDFDREAMLRVNPVAVDALKTTSPSSMGAMAIQNWRWAVSPRFTFSETASRMEYFHRDLGYRWTLDLEGNAPVSKRFSVTAAYRIREETNTYIKALRVKPMDRTFTLGIRFSI